MKTIRRFLYDTQGIANVSRIFGIGSMVLGYLFMAQLHSTITDQEKDAHYYNSMVMAQSVRTQIHRSFALASTMMQSSVLDVNGDPRFTRSELESYLKIDHEEMISLRTLIESGYVSLTEDPTASRLAEEGVLYDVDASKVQVFYNTAEHSDTSMVTDILYRVNIAGKNLSTNTSPFFYLVSFVDSGTGVYGSYNLSSDDITFDNGLSDSHNSIFNLKISSITSMVHLPES